MMTETEALNKFDELIQKAKVVSEDLYNGDIRPVLEEILDHVIDTLKIHPRLRIVFAEVFIRIVYERNFAPQEITMFCMHALRWDEVRNVLEGRNKVALTLREKSFVEHVLLAFNDDWKGAYAYKRFGGGQGDLSY